MSSELAKSVISGLIELAGNAAGDKYNERKILSSIGVEDESEQLVYRTTAYLSNSSFHQAWVDVYVTSKKLIIIPIGGNPYFVSKKSIELSKIRDTDFEKNLGVLRRDYVILRIDGEADQYLTYFKEKYYSFNVLPDAKRQKNFRNIIEKIIAELR